MTDGRPDRPSMQSRPVAVRLHARPPGACQWEDRGEQVVPAATTTADPGRTLILEGVAYVVEDVFDDGRQVNVWVRTADRQSGAARGATGRPGADRPPLGAPVSSRTRRRGPGAGGYARS